MLAARMGNFLNVTILLLIIKVVCLLVAIAYYTLAERKIMASVQRRLGPNVVGFWGLLQPLADGLKLFGKELVIPSHANSRIFMLAPMGVLGCAFIAWGVIPFNLIDHSSRMGVEKLTRVLLALDGEGQDMPLDRPLWAWDSWYSDEDSGRYVPRRKRTVMRGGLGWIYGEIDTSFGELAPSASTAVERLQKYPNFGTNLIKLDKTPSDDSSTPTFTATHIAIPAAGKKWERWQQTESPQQVYQHSKHKNRVDSR